MATSTPDAEPGRSAEDWLASFAEAVGQPPPDAATIETLLDLAGVAAHASARTAAPIACWLVGRAGLDVEAALRVAREVSTTD